MEPNRHVSKTQALEQLRQMFNELSESVIAPYLEEAGGDIDKTVDELLTIASYDEVSKTIRPSTRPNVPTQQPQQKHVPKPYVYDLPQDSPQHLVVNVHIEKEQEPKAVASVPDQQSSAKAGNGSETNVHKETIPKEKSLVQNASPPSGEVCEKIVSKEQSPSHAFVPRTSAEEKMQAMENALRYYVDRLASVTSVPEQQRILVEESIEKLRQGLLELSITHVKPTTPETVPKLAKSTCVVEGCVCVDNSSSIQASWRMEGGDSVPSSGDWIGLYYWNRQKNKNYSASFYTGGVAEGTHIFSGLHPGLYDLRLFLNKSYSYVSKSQCIRVGTLVELKTVLDVSFRNVNVSWLFPSASRKPSSHDWVALFRRDEPSNKRYLQHKYCPFDCKVSFSAPRHPGEYDVRLFLSGSGYFCQAISDVITIPNRDKLDVRVEGQVLIVDWAIHSVAISGSDWIGVFRSNEGNQRRYRCCEYLPKEQLGSESGTINIDLSKLDVGSYEARLFPAAAMGKYFCLLTSRTFVVA